MDEVDVLEPASVEPGRHDDVRVRRDEAGAVGSEPFPAISAMILV